MYVFIQNILIRQYFRMDVDSKYSESWHTIIYCKQCG